MRIALVNGSPKVEKSASGILLGNLKEYLLGKRGNLEAEPLEIGMHRRTVPEEALGKLTGAEAWVFAFPLYVDGIPGHLLSCLSQLEEAWRGSHNVQAYGIVNCGFYEGIQAEPALELLGNWCGKTGFTWCGGVGVGGGGALGQMPSGEKGHGPWGPVDLALESLADRILQRESQGNQYVSVAFPRFLYKMAAQMGWRQMIKGNGGKRKDLGARPE